MNDLLGIAIIAIGVPMSLIGFFFTRAYAKARADLPRPRRVSRRADLFNSITDEEHRQNEAIALASMAICVSNLTTMTVING